MDERQYRTMLTNCRPRGVQGLLLGEASRRVLQSAGWAFRRRRRVALALEHVVPASWLAVMRVEQAAGDMVTLAVTDRLVFERLRVEQQRVMAALRDHVPGVGRLHLVLRSPGAAGERADTQ
jgi:hypothetical protein